MTRLPAVLSPIDLPEAELHALRLDSEVFSIGEGFAPVDQLDRARLRGASLAVSLPPRLIAERETAAWVLGARDHPPAVHELCADATARFRCVGRSALAVREVTLQPADTEVHGGLRVTTALRTVLDLARFSPVFDESKGDVLRRLAALGGFDRDRCALELERRRNLPGKVRALARIRTALA